MYDAAKGEHIARSEGLSNVPDQPGARTLKGLPCSIEQGEVMTDRNSETPTGGMGNRFTEQSVGEEAGRNPAEVMTSKP
jgi:hypothetical protein